MPVSARGFQSWPPASIDHHNQARSFTLVYDEPETSATVVALLDEGAIFLDGVPGTWVPVDHVLASIHVTGWALVPEDQQRHIRVFDFRDDVIEGELVRPEGMRD